MYDYIFFDLDGTLTDPVMGITNSVMYALKKFNIEVDDRKELYKFIGPPLKDGFMNYYGFSEREAVAAVEYYRENFRVKGLFENEVYDGTVALLEKIKQAGKKIILATSKPEEFALIILKHFDLFKYFDLVCGATFDEKRSEKPQVIEYAINKLRICDTSRCVMIGDRKYDIEGAKCFKMDSIGVTYGYGSREELENEGATHIVDRQLDILKLL